MSASPRAWPIVLGVLTLALGCSSRQWTGPMSRFPEPRPAGAVVLPIRDPLLGPWLEVLAELAAQPPKTTAVQQWMVVDSGSAAVSVSSDMATRLGLEAFARADLHTAARGVLHAGVVMLPRLSLGQLEVTDVIASQADHEPPLFGQSVLGSGTWEIDWDRGRLVLLAETWPEGTPGVTRVPLQRIPGAINLESVPITIQGKGVQCALDTGAQGSSLNPELYRGLRPRELSSPMPRGVDRQYLAESWLGSLPLGTVGYFPLPEQVMPRCLLGIDVLSRFHFQVVPGQYLQLRARESLWDTAPERVSRWSWTASCKQRGCVEATLEPVGETTRLSLRVERAPPEDVELLLGCEGDANPVVSVTEVMARGGSARGAMAHVLVRLAARSSGTLQATLRQPENYWFRRPGSCSRLAVLDVVPLAAKLDLPEPLGAFLAL